MKTSGDVAKFDAGSNAASIEEMASVLMNGPKLCRNR